MYLKHGKKEKSGTETGASGAAVPRLDRAKEPVDPIQADEKKITTVHL